MQDAARLREAYEQLWRERTLQESPAYYERILDLLAARPGSRLLDVGCGGGYLLAAAERRGVEGHGIDIAEAALRQAKAICSRSTLAQASAEALPYADESFDVITCLGSIEHFLNPVVALSEMRRALHRNGKACFVLPNRWFLLDVLRGWFQGEGQSHGGQEIERFYSLHEARRLLREGGFWVVDVKGYSPKAETVAAAWSTPMGHHLGWMVYEVLRGFLPLSSSYVFVLLCVKEPIRVPNPLLIGERRYEDFLSPGWYGIEDWPPKVRWMSRQATGYLTRQGPLLYFKALCSHPDLVQRPVEGRVMINGQEIGCFCFELSDVNKFREHRFQAPGSGDVVEVTIEVDRTWQPRGDVRQLGLAVQEIGFR